MSDQSTYVGPSLVAVGPTYPLWLYHPIFAPVLVDNVLQQNALIASDARWSVVPGAYSTPLVTVLSAFAAGCALDGITDDTTAFQALLNQVGTAPAAISITGSMFLASSIIIPANVQFIFAGNGRVKPAASVIVTMNGAYTAGAWQVWDTSAPASKITGLMKPSYGFLLPEHWGAIGDDKTDDTFEFQQTAKAAADAGNLDIHLLSKTYLLSATVFASGSNNQLLSAPRWIGQGVDNTTLDYAGIASGSACFKFRGQSGHNAMKVVLEGVTLQGNVNSIGVMFAGANNMRVRDCRFTTNLYGVEFHNEDVSSFTEFCHADHCQFTGACITEVHYKRTSGNDSHHGSGLLNQCLVSQNGGDVILVDSNSEPYQSALDVVVFPAGACNLINNQRSSAPVIDFIGSIRVELSGGTIALGANNTVDFQGPVAGVGLTNTTGAGMTAGTLRRIKTKSVYQDSSSLVTGFERGSTIAITTGANTLASAARANHRIVYARLTGGNYDYRYLLSVDHDGSGGAGYVQILATLRTLNTAGYGAPAFTVGTNGDLVATQAGWPASGVNCYLYESELSGDVAGGGQMQY